MIDFLMLLACVLTRLFRSRARLEAEILDLRHQLSILQRSDDGALAHDGLQSDLGEALRPTSPSNTKVLLADRAHDA
jgi:hypothetical protein